MAEKHEKYSHHITREASGTDMKDLRSSEESYQEVEIFEVPALFSNRRISAEEVPKGFYRYDLRGSDYDPGNPVTVENNVVVNHAGTLLTLHPLHIPERGFLYLGEELNFVGANLVPSDFRELYAGMDSPALDDHMENAISRADEQLLFTPDSSVSRYAIYQLDENGDGIDKRFMNLSYIKSHNEKVAGGEYALVYSGVLSPQTTLDEIYVKFNLNHPEGFTGHSLSVSDVVVLNRDGEVHAFYMDSVGFPELSEFIQQREEMLKANNTELITEQSAAPKKSEAIDSGKMPDYSDVPVYYEPFAYAKENGEVDLFHLSKRLNVECKDAIEQAVRENFDGMHLNHDAAKGVLAAYGEERVKLVLANTIQHKDYDGRFSHDNKEWALGMQMPVQRSDVYDNSVAFIAESHPAVLNGFVDLFRQEVRAKSKEKIISPISDCAESEASGTVKKVSVLKKLQAQQTRLKQKEQGPTKQKVQSKKRNEPEL